jgi:DNA polymerase-3 subunit delta
VDTDPRKFSEQLKKKMPLVVLVACEEMLDQEEVGDAVIEIARAQGYAERTAYHADHKDFPWNDVGVEAGSMSLFSERRILDVRVQIKFMDKRAGEFLKEYVAKPVEDNLLLLRTAYLNKRVRGTKWYKEIAPHALCIHSYAVKDAEMPRWLENRCRREGVSLSRDALNYLAQRLEGNLLAAAQEVARLKIINSEGPIDIQAVKDSVAAANHYRVWDLLDAAFARQAPRVRRMCGSLQDEGVSPLVPLNALVARLRGAARGGGGELQSVLGRRGPAPYLAECALIDLQAKGGLSGDAWQSLQRLLLALAGARTTPSLSTTHRALTEHF